MTPSTLERSRYKSDTDVRTHSKRLDIQGLRTIAVLAVVANHLTGFPTGGFVGVDIFFVISGFVITLGLLREHDRSATVSLKAFYFRRAARLMPASVLTIVLTVLMGYFAFFNERANGVALDGLAAFFFSANWRFALTETDYWAEDSPASPLQHFWSLAVEEQFYFLWPILLMVVLTMGTRFGLGRVSKSIILPIVLGSLIVLSFIWALAETDANATLAYFSTLSRVWELGVGALLAVMSPVFAFIRFTIRTCLAWLGISGIIVGIVFISKSQDFPAPWAALPVLSTALVIMAGTAGTVPGFAFLTNKVSAYIGNASYSLYLWHFPIIVLLSALWPDDGWTYYLVVICLTGFLAVVSYELVEIPAQQRMLQWYKSRQRRPSFSGVVGDHTRHGRVRFKLLGLGVLAIATVITVPLAVHQHAPSQSDAGFAPVATPVREGGGAVVDEPEDEAGRLSSEISSALSAKVWPNLSPSFDNLLEEGRPVEDDFGCASPDLSSTDCVFGTDKAETIVVIGDSTGITLLPTVRGALGDEFNVRGMTKPGCTLLDFDVKMDSTEAAEDCRAFLFDAIAEINRIQPSLVFLTNNAHTRHTSGAQGAAAKEEWRMGTESVLEKLKPSGARLIVITAPPGGKPPLECATRNSSPVDCSYVIPQYWFNATRAMTEAAEHSGADIIDTREWFCSSVNSCPAFVGTVPVKRDGVHTTRQYAERLIPLLEEELGG